jgi:hypothetical protein
VYDLPNRWQAQINEVGEKLFRRMRDYTRFVGVEADDTNIRVYLHELLYLLDQEDLSREPYGITMTWWLAYLIKNDLAHNGNPLTEEIAGWSRRQIKRSAKMRAHGDKISSLIDTITVEMPSETP